jgi:predicted outer membrane repeat protein
VRLRLTLHLSLVVASLPAQAATLTVDKSGSTGFSSIQAAVAQAQNGDRIEVLAGTYETAVNPGGKDLHFLAVGTVLLLPESDPLTPIFTLNSNESASTQIEGFLFNGGIGISTDHAGVSLIGLEFDSTDQPNSAALLQNGGEVNIENSTFSGGTGVRGSQIQSVGGILSIESSTFFRNHASVAGGAIWVHEGELHLNANTFDENRCDFLGGAVALEDSTSWMEDNTFLDNTAENGGGVGGQNSTILSKNNTFDDNLAEDGGAIGLSACYDPPEPEDTLQIPDCEGLEGLIAFDDEASSFLDNVSLHHGGGLYLRGEFFPEETTITSTFLNTQWTGNFAGSRGGGLYVRDNIGLQMETVVFSQNESQSNGGGYFTQSSRSEVSIANSTFERNKTNYSSGGAFYNYNDNHVLVENCTFKGNQANDSGGAIAHSSGYNLVIRDSLFKSNETETRSGGAISFEDDYKYDLLLEKNVFLNNQSGLHGGAIYANEARDIHLSNNHLEGNETASNGAGGALMFWDQSAVRIHGNLFLNNSAHYGGASYSESTWPRVDGEPSALKTDEWTNNSFRGNHALWGGALAFLSNPLTDFRNNTLLENTAEVDGSGLHMYLSFGRFRSNLFAFSTQGRSIVAADEISGQQAKFWNNAFWQNSDADFGEVYVTETDGNFTADPLLAGGFPEAAPEDHSDVLTLGSPLINAGESQLDDPDGTNGDIGARGGPDFVEEDVDEDGFSNQYDCDDQDPEVFPNAPERWYDGINQDCSTGSDYDQDQDGAKSASYGGPDCDDKDPKRIEHCETEEPAGSCACTSSKRSPKGPIAWIALVFLVRRKRKSA